MLNVRPKILIIDDCSNNIKILREILSDEADIKATLSGNKALELAVKHQPNLILLDVVMMGRSGFEVITQLKNDDRTRVIPVIFITGLTEVDDEQKGLSLGACDYIQKPFDDDIVLARVKLHL